MKRFGKVLFCSAVMIVIGSVAYAGNTADPGIRERLDNQQKRIDQGIATGDLTRTEAHRLQHGLSRIKVEEARLKADGRLTRGERARLHRELDRESARIYHKRHNSRRA